MFTLYFPLIGSHGGCSVQPGCLWWPGASRGVCCIKSDQRGSSGEITHSERTTSRVSAGHRWHTARLEAPGWSWWWKSEGCGHVDVAVWGEEPPGNWQSIQMEAILQSLKGMACKCIHSLLPTCMPPSCPCDVWMKPSRSGWGWCGGGQAGNLRVSFEACLMAFLCQVSLQGHAGNLALESIFTFKTWGWVHASNLERLSIKTQPMTFKLPPCTERDVNKT